MHNPGLIVTHALMRIGGNIPDKTYLKLMYFFWKGKRLNLDRPVTFNEKLQWLKLYYRRPELTVMVDKVKAKDYVTSKIGAEHVIPTLGVWDSPDDIDFEKLPQQFVLKTNHNSGCNVICTDKSTLDIEAAKAKLRKGLRETFYKRAREWAYKDVPRKILAEKYMVDESGTELKDYKFFCFGGEPRVIQVDFNRYTNHRRNLYDTEWRLLDFEIEYPSDKNHIIAKPQPLEEMLEAARCLSEDLPHVRVDLYCIGDKIYFGEMTFYHGGGYEVFTPEEWNRRMGEMITLPDTND